MLKGLTTDQRKLAAYISELSERAYFSEWQQRIEFALWDIIVQGPRKYGREEITLEILSELQSFSNKINGWIYFDDKNEETFVSIETVSYTHLTLPTKD